jgi:hypothetical protein
MATNIKYISDLLNLKLSNYLVVETPKFGNLIDGVGNNIKSYSNEWVKESKNNSLDCVISDSGKSCSFICKNEFVDTASIELRAKILYDTELSFDFHSDEDTRIILWIIPENKKKIRVNPYQKKIIKILKNSDICFRIESFKSEIGNIIANIYNIKFATSQFNHIKIPLSDTIDFISSKIKENK